MPTKITVRNNGSLRVEGDIELFDQNGNKYDVCGRSAVSLCRCGQSNNKPFCDSTHKKTGFQSECTAFIFPLPKPAP